MGGGGPVMEDYLWSARWAPLLCINPLPYHYFISCSFKQDVDFSFTGINNGYSSASILHIPVQRTLRSARGVIIIIFHQGTKSILLFDKSNLPAQRKQNGFLADYSQRISWRTPGNECGNGYTSILEYCRIQVEYNMHIRKFSYSPLLHFVQFFYILLIDFNHNVQSTIHVDGTSEGPSFPILHSHLLDWQSSNREQFDFVTFDSFTVR